MTATFLSSCEGREPPLSRCGNPGSGSQWASLPASDFAGRTQVTLERGMQGVENPMDRGAWRATVHGVAKWDTTE